MKLKELLETQNFKYPIFKKDRASDMIVKFTDLTTAEVISGHKKVGHKGTFVKHTDKSIWVDVDGKINESTDKKTEALAKFLRVNTEKVKHDGDLYIVGDAEYLVLTDREATQEAIDYNENLLDDIGLEILFNNKELKKELYAGSYTKNGKDNETNQFLRFYDEDPQHVTDELQKRKLLDYKKIAKDIVKFDGRGYGLASYDSKELKLNAGLFAYRVN